MVKVIPHKRHIIVEDEAKYTANWFRRQFTTVPSGTETDRVYFKYTKFDVELSYYAFCHAQILLNMAEDETYEGTKDAYCESPQ